MKFDSPLKPHIRVCLVVTDLGLGGTQAWIEYTTAILGKNNIAVCVIAESMPHDRKAAIMAYGAEVHCFDVPQPLTKYAEIISRFQCHIVHLNVWRREADLILLGRMTKTKLILAYHSVPQRTIRSTAGALARYLKMCFGFRNRDLSWYSLMAAKKYIDVHLGCCSASARGIRKLYGPFFRNRIYALPYGVPIPQVYQKEEGSLVFLQVGALTRRKGPDTTLKAFASVPMLGNIARLEFVGDGPLRDALLKEKFERRLDSVSLRGAINDVSECYRNSDVVLLPSYCEGLPFTLLEGAAWGKALIGSAVDGIPEICKSGESGILVRPGDIGGLAAAMAYLAQNNAVRTRLGEGARMLAKKEFSLEMLGARLGALYRNTLNLKATS